MVNMQNTKTGSVSEPKADTLGDSILLPKQDNTGKVASKNFPPHIAATTQSVSKKTLKNVDLEALRLKAGLVAGALADFQTAGGLVVVKNMEYEGGKFVKLFLVAEHFDLVVSATTDGVDFSIEPIKAVV